MKRKNTITTLKYLGKFFSFLILVFLLKKLITNWQVIRDYEISVNYFLFILSIVIGIVPVFIAALNWRLILYAVSDTKLGYLNAIRIHIVSWLYRYVPGKVSSAISKLLLCKKFEIDKKDVLFSYLYENINIILSSVIVSVPLIFFAVKENFVLSDLQINIFFLVVGFGVLFIFSSFFERLFLIFVRIFKIKKDFEFKKINKISSVKFLFYYIINRAVLGFSFYAVIISVANIDINKIFYIVGVYALAGVVAIVINIAPSGIGIREGVMVLLLNLFFPLELSIVISLLSRASNMFSDLILFIISVILNKYEKNYNN